MLVVLCVDLDDDLGRKTDIETPVIGREPLERAAVTLATTDPEDSDVNVLFEGLRIYDELVTESDAVEIAAITGTPGNDVTANRRAGTELDDVLAALDSPSIRALVVTDGAQDESILPVIRSRVPVDGVRRVIVRQAQNLESVYYTIKQVLADPETRGTILVPLGILLLIYPLAVIAEYFGLPGAILGMTSALLGFYVLFRGLALDESLDRFVETARQSFYAGRVTLVTYFVALVLLLIGTAEGFAMLSGIRETTASVGPLGIVSALTYGAIQWLAAAGITSSLGRITDDFLADQFEWRYLNAPFYVLAITSVLYAVSGFIIGRVSLTLLAALLTIGTLLGVLSTLTFAVVETWHGSNAHA